MTKLSRITYCLLAVALFQMAAPASSSAGAPSEEMRATVEAVLATLQDPQIRTASKKSERHQRLKTIIEPRFDFAEMGKRSLGPYWKRTTPEERNRFIYLFTELVETAYLDVLDSYNGEKVVIGNDEKYNDDIEFAEVKSKILAKTGTQFAVDYKLYQSDGTWKVYDVVLENVSLVSNYRSQFSRVIAHSSLQELLTRLKGKQFEAPGKRQKV